MLLYGFLVLVGLILIGGFIRGWQSQTQPELGLVQEQLRMCPDKPNCVNSQSDPGDNVHNIEPISDADWQALQQAIAAAGGHIVKDDGHYLHATFTSRLFRFVDDVEALRDDSESVIHIRSASRVGYSDLGVNRKRVEAIRMETVRMQTIRMQKIGMQKIGMQKIGAEAAEKKSGRSLN